MRVRDLKTSHRMWQVHTLYLVDYKMSKSNKFNVTKILKIAISNEFH